MKKYFGMDWIIKGSDPDIISTMDPDLITLSGHILNWFILDVWIRGISFRIRNPDYRFESKVTRPISPRVVL